MGEEPWRDLAGYAMLMLRRRGVNEWALTWASEGKDPFIEAVFPTREQAESKHRVMAEKMPRLTWRVCRVDEVK